MKSIPINFDKPRKLRLDVNAMADAEERLGLGVRQIMQRELSFAMMRVLLWAGLKWEDVRLTPERVGKLLQAYLEKGGDMQELGTKVSEAMIASGLVKPEDAQDVLDEMADEDEAEVEAPNVSAEAPDK